MPLHTWLLFLVTVFFVSATPGPNMLLALTHGLQFGLRRTLRTCCGLICGLLIIMTASVIGLGALLAASEQLFSVVKYAGAAYLIWVGIKTWRSPSVLPSAGQLQQQAMHSGRGLFVRGLLVALSNPKAFIFFSALFPQFIDARLPQMPQLLILTITFCVVECLWQFIYAGSGRHIGRWIKDAKHMRWINYVSGTCFIVAGALIGTLSHHR